MLDSRCPESRHLPASRVTKSQPRIIIQSQRRPRLASFIQQSQHSAGSVGSESCVNLPLAVDQFNPLSLQDALTLGGKGD
jgi:hypothetical protein